MILKDDHKAINMFDNQIFWKSTFDGEEAKGGFFIRSVDLKKSLESIEQSDEGGEVVGLKFNNNNLEVIVKENNNDNSKEE